MCSRRDQIIKQYLDLADDTHSLDYLRESHKAYEELYHDAVLAQSDFMKQHNITRAEIDEYKKRGVKRFDNVDDAMKAMFGGI